MKKHTNLICAWARQPDGTTVWAYDDDNKEWYITLTPKWAPTDKYALIGKHEEASKAFALGEKLEFRPIEIDKWINCPNPTWENEFDYRAIEQWKPKQKEMLLVRQHGMIEEFEREFIAKTSDNRYACWNEDKTYLDIWDYAKEIE